MRDRYDSSRSEIAEWFYLFPLFVIKVRISVCQASLAMKIESRFAILAIDRRLGSGQLTTHPDFGYRLPMHACMATESRN